MVAIARKSFTFLSIFVILLKDAKSKNSTQDVRSERSRLVKGFGVFAVEPAYEQQKGKRTRSETSAGGHRYQRHVSVCLR